MRADCVVERLLFGRSCISDNHAVFAARGSIAERHGNPVIVRCGRVAVRLVWRCSNGTICSMVGYIRNHFDFPRVDAKPVSFISSSRTICYFPGNRNPVYFGLRSIVVILGPNPRIDSGIMSGCSCSVEYCNRANGGCVTGN